MAHPAFLARLRQLASEDVDALVESRFDNHIVLGNVTDQQILNVLRNPSDDVWRLVRYARTICDGAENYTAITEAIPFTAPSQPPPPPRLAIALAKKR